MLQKRLSIRGGVFGLLRRAIGKVGYLMGYIVLLPLSYCIPKRRRTILFTTRFGDFEGNVKHLFLYANKLEEDGWDCIFLTTKREVYERLREAHLLVWLYPRLTTCWKMLRAYVIIVDGNEWARYLKYFFLYGAKKVQLWHGTGLKSVGLLKPTIKKLGPFRKRLKKESILYDLVLFTSSYQLENRREAFRFKKHFISGYPRNDILFEPPMLRQEKHLGCDGETIEEVLAWRHQGFFIVLYAPTWRKSLNTFDYLDLQAMDSFARAHNILFLFKLHYKQEYHLEIDRYKNIVEHNTYADIYPLLSLAHLLITDYSSIYLDYLLLHRPILFFPYDKKEYIAKERELLLNYDDVTPGPQCFHQEELLAAIYQHLVGREDPYRKEREKLRDQFFDYQDGVSKKRIWKTIKDELLTNENISLESRGQNGKETKLQ